MVLSGVAHQTQKGSKIMPSFLLSEMLQKTCIVHNETVEIVVVRVKKIQGFPMAMAKPCSVCLPVLKQSGVDIVHYSDHNGMMKTETVCAMISDHVCAGIKIMKYKSGENVM